MRVGVSIVLVMAVLAVIAACADADRTTDDAESEPVAETGTPVPEAEQTPVASPEPTPTIADPPIAADYDPMKPADDTGAILDEREIEEIRIIPPTFYDVDVGPDGELFLIYKRAAVLRLSSEGEFLDLWNDELEAATALAVDSRGVVSVSDQRLHRFSSDGEYQRFLRTGDFLRGERIRAQSLGVSPNDYLYASHANENHITRFTPDGDEFEEFQEARDSPGGPGSRIDFDAAGRMFHLVTGPPGETAVHVRDSEGNELDEWELEEYVDEEFPGTHVASTFAVVPDGRVVTLIPLGDEGSVEAQSGIMPMVRDYVIQVCSPDGELETSWKAVEDTELDTPLWSAWQFTIDDDGTIFMPDGGPVSHRIQRFSLDGEFLSELGHGLRDELCELERAIPSLDCER